MVLKSVIPSAGSGGGGTGTVTQVSTGYGLTGGPITTTGTLSVADITTTGATTARSLSNHFTDIHNAADWGAVADGLQLVDINITNGTPTANSLRYEFVAADIGATFVLTTAGFGSVLNGTITGITGGNATLSANWAGTTISGNTGRMTFYHTNNTTALQAAIDNIVATHADNLGHNLIGFKLKLPNGIIAVNKITIPRLGMLLGEGAQATILFCISGTNDNCVESENFSTLVNQNKQYGVDANVPSWFGVEDLHIDGNRGGNSSGHCLAMYGVSQRIQGDCLFENGASDNLFTESGTAGSYSATDWRAEEEAYFENVTSRNSGGNGWLCHGPHDYFCVRYTAYNNATWNFYSESSANYNGGGEITNIHTYASVLGQDQYLGAGTIITQSYTDFGNLTIASGSKIGVLRQIQVGYLGLNGVEITDAADFAIIGTHSLEFRSANTGIVGVNIQPSADNCTISHVSGAVSPGGAPCTFIKNRGSFTSIEASMSNMAGVGSIGLDNSADFLQFRAVGFFNTTGILWAGGSRCNVLLQQYQGTTPLSGTPNSTNTIQITSDLTNASTFQAPWLTNITPRTITATIDGGGSVITTGIKSDVQMAFSGTITGWTILGDQVGGIVFDIWRDTYANYPPTAGDSITASAKPTVAASNKGTSVLLAGWNPSFTLGDTFRFNVDSVSSMTRAILEIYVSPTVRS